MEGKKVYSYVGENKEILDAELWAISEALDIANEESANDETANGRSTYAYNDFSRLTKKLSRPIILLRISPPLLFTKTTDFQAVCYTKRLGELQSNGQPSSLSNGIPKPFKSLRKIRKPSDLAAAKLAEKRWETNGALELTSICDCNPVKGY